METLIRDMKFTMWTVNSWQHTKNNKQTEWEREEKNGRGVVYKYEIYVFYTHCRYHTVYTRYGKENGITFLYIVFFVILAHAHSRADTLYIHTRVYLVSRV